MIVKRSTFVLVLMALSAGIAVADKPGQHSTSRAVVEKSCGKVMQELKAGKSATTFLLEMSLAVGDMAAARPLRPDSLAGATEASLELTASTECTVLVLQKDAAGKWHTVGSGATVLSAGKPTRFADNIAGAKGIFVCSKAGANKGFSEFLPDSFEESIQGATGNDIKSVAEEDGAVFSAPTNVNPADDTSKSTYLHVTNKKFMAKEFPL